MDHCLSLRKERDGYGYEPKVLVFSTAAERPGLLESCMTLTSSMLLGRCGS